MRPPSTFHGFVGQRQLVDHLRRLIAGACARGEPMLHLLLCGRTGIGKTLLARAIAREVANLKADDALTNLKTIVSGRDVRASDIVEMLHSLSPFDVLFIDEIHALGRDAQECLLLVIDERKTFALREDGSIDRASFKSVCAFTLIGATNIPSGMRGALRNRLRACEFEDYTSRDIRAIAESYAIARGIAITAQAIRYVAERSRRSPRRVRQLLDEIRLGCPRVQLDLDAVRTFLAGAGIDDNGLGPVHRRALKLLASARNRTLGHEVLAAQLGLDCAFVRCEIEPPLSELAFIDNNARGKRRITAEGIAAITEIATDADDDEAATPASSKGEVTPCP